MDFQKLYDKLRQNVQEYPAILDRLASDFGVERATLEAFGTTYVPTVMFDDRKAGSGSKRPSHGWWATPERDHKAKITGLTLRSWRSGRVKPMWPGSHHGLIYSVASGYTAGEDPYAKGSHNWVRLTDAGLPCPICGKPDGCLLSADNPEDPQAVICIRIRDGCERPMRLGYLHVLKESGRLTSRCPLPESDLPICVVEGLSDAVVLHSLGFVTVGRPSALFTTGLRPLLRGRKVIIFGENDKEDRYGNVVGWDGMHKTFELLDSVCDAQMVLPPEPYKDVREWVQADKINADGVRAWVNEHGQRTVTRVPLSSGSPLPVAGEWLKAMHWKDDLPLLRKYQGSWYRWDGKRYVEIADTDGLRGQLYDWLDGRRYEKHTDDGDLQLLDYEPTRSKINDILDALNRWCPVGDDAPCWLDGRTGVNPKDLICFSNGVLDVDAYLAGQQPYMSPASPVLFATTCLPYEFDTTATAPTWQQWLRSTFGDDEEGRRKIALLQEWFGYCMTTDMSMEKLFLMIGRPRSGKGTSLEMFRALLGKNQVATTKFSTLAGAHGLEPLIGKLAAIMPDARVPRQTDSMQALELLLAIVGGDGVDVNPKNRPIIPDVKLTTRFTVATNELPELPDHSHALESRLMVLHFNRSFKDNPDRSLKHRLPKEAPGAAVWALEGLRRLRKRGEFTEPESSGRIIEDFRRVTSPVMEFVDECCYIRENAQVEAGKLFATWQGWCNDRNLRSGHKMRFEQRLLASCPGCGTLSNGRRKAYTGIEIDPNALKEYG